MHPDEVPIGVVHANAEGFQLRARRLRPAQQRGHRRVDDQQTFRPGDAVLREVDHQRRRLLERRGRDAEFPVEFVDRRSERVQSDVRQTGRVEQVVRCTGRTGQTQVEGLHDRCEVGGRRLQRLP